MATPSRVRSLELCCNAAEITASHRTALFDGARKANKRTVSTLVRVHLPDFHKEVWTKEAAAKIECYLTDTHFIVQGVDNEYFLEFKK